MYRTMCGAPNAASAAAWLSTQFNATAVNIRPAGVSGKHDAARAAHVVVTNHSALGLRLRLSNGTYEDRSEVHVIPARGRAFVPAEFWRRWCAENSDSHALATRQLVAA